VIFAASSTIELPSIISTCIAQPRYSTARKDMASSSSNNELQEFPLQPPLRMDGQLYLWYVLEDIRPPTYRYPLKFIDPCDVTSGDTPASRLSELVRLSPNYAGLVSWESRTHYLIRIQHLSRSSGIIIPAPVLHEVYNTWLRNPAVVSFVPDG
jgi:hypothetical protein